MVNRIYLVYHIVRSGGNAIHNWIRSTPNRKYVVEKCAQQKWEEKKLLAKNSSFKSSYITDAIERDFIYTFESEDIETFRGYKMETFEQIISAKLVIPVVIIRDHFNLLASMFRKYGSRFATDMWLKDPSFYEKDERPRQRKMRVPSVREIWINMARDALKDRELLEHPNKVVVNFNRWFEDEDYKIKIESKLQILRESNDLYVSSAGGGSSFDGRKFSGSAKEMDVLNRWKHYSSNKEFELLVRDDELIDLSSRLFNFRSM